AKPERREGEGSESPPAAAGRESVPPGTVRIEGYRLREKIGEGAFGEVYRAEQKGLDRSIAIKVLSKELSESPDDIHRFEREALVLARLQHRSIVWIIDKGRTSDDRYFIAMEYVDGLSLRKVIEDGLLDLGERVRLVLEIADTLAYTHSQEVIHRDLKPENVMIYEAADRKRCVKILDFGLAGLVRRGSRSESSHLTGADTRFGTPFYTSPEQQVSFRDVDERTDIYSLGVMFYELLTGDLPAGIFQPPSAANPDSIPELDPIVTRMLEPDRNKRFQTMREATDVLRKVLEGRKIPPAQPRVQNARPPSLSPLATVTEQKQIRVEGRSRPGQRISIQVNTRLYTATADDSGVFASLVTLRDGRNTITARSEDRWGSSRGSEPIEVSSLPLRPELVDLPARVESSVWVVRGRASPGALIRVQVQDREYQAASDDRGDWAVDVGLDDGPNAVRSWSVVDQAECREPVTGRIVRPVTPPSLAPPSTWTRSSRLTLRGTSPAGATIRAKVGERIVEGEAGPGGAFALEVALDLGTNEIRVQAIRDGVASAWTPGARIWRTPPAGLVALVVLAALAALGNVLHGLVAGRPVVTAKVVQGAGREVVATGRGPARATIRIFGGGPLAETRSGPDGSFEARFAVAPGRHTLTVAAVTQGREAGSCEAPFVALPTAPTSVTWRTLPDRALEVEGLVEEGCGAVAELAGEVAQLSVTAGPTRGAPWSFKGRLRQAPGPGSALLFAVLGDLRSAPHLLVLETPPAPPQLDPPEVSEDGTSARVRGVCSTADARIEFRGRTAGQVHTFVPSADGSFEGTLALDSGANTYTCLAFLARRPELRSAAQTLVVTGLPAAPEELSHLVLDPDGTRARLTGVAPQADAVVVYRAEREVAVTKVSRQGRFSCAVPLEPGQNHFKVRATAAQMPGNAASITIPVRPP
ncbi:MAG: serine/threonine protein kinase, partial [Candidatus Riflebacteria bacterium]|nr:serine/threonine protein kinase [Candidatus Riflebacteria bacterium]